MWHEARKQEKKIRGMLVDYRKRADRRKEFYEKIKADPNQFLQVHGRKCKIHYEVTDMTDDMHMMPWQGQKDNLIDRFDVRAHLDYIPPRKEEPQEEKITEQDRQVNYESYRVLAQNEFLGINESDFLRQILLEEQFGSAEKGNVDSDKKKKNSQANAAIGYTYEDSTANSASSSVPFSQQILSIETSTASSSRFEEYAKEYSDESDIDMDVQVDVKKIGTTQAHELNNFGKKYGMTSNDLFSYLTRDEEEKQSMKVMKEQEADKILGGGRKSRRERRSQREKRILGKPLTFSPPSYAAKEEKIPENEDESDKSSRESKSPSIEKITYITSFGGEEELQPHAKISIPFKKTLPKNLINLRRNETFADKVRENSDRLRQLNETEKRRNESRRRSRSRSSSRRRRRSRSNSRRRRYRSRSYSRSRGRRRANRHSSRSYSRSYSRSRSVSRGRYPNRRRSSSYKKKSSYRSRSRDRRRSSSRERSRNRRKYSSSSSSSSTTSSSSSSTHRSVSSPEKRSHKEKSISKEKSQSPIREERAASSPKASVASTLEVQPLPPPTVKRYYGRKRDNESSSSLSVDSDDNDDDERRQTGSNDSSANDVQKVRSADIKIGLSKSTVGPPTIVNPREKLKKKMQILLNKQYKADKKAETEKIERQIQQQQERDEEMRELAIKLRRRQRELRHKYGEETKDSRTNSESDENGSKRRERNSKSSSSSSSSSEEDTKRRRSCSNSSSTHRKRFKTSISRSPVKYGARRSRSKSSGRNYRRRYSRSRSRDYRR